MVFKVFCDGCERGPYNDIETALNAYKIFSCEYRKDFTVVLDSDDFYGKILVLPNKRAKDLTVEDIQRAIEELK